MFLKESDPDLGEVPCSGQLDEWIAIAM
ncbi:MAG: hypothetical protein RLZZ256_959, partial [Bacteroidota bacterium]